MVNTWKKSTKSTFEEELKKVIRESIISMKEQRLFRYELINVNNQNEVNNENVLSLKDDSNYLAENENWYKSPDLKAILVLLDIIDICNSDSNEKLPALFFSSFNEDEEHIFPQTPIEKVNPSEYEKQTKKLKKYVEIVNYYLKENNDSPIVLDEDDIHWSDDNWREEQRIKYNNLILKYVPINSLGNMALLNESVNKSYGNNFFTEKRIDIMKAYRVGGYIRPHVMDAFNKQYLERTDLDDDFSRMQSWTKEDILARREYIVKVICKFLNIQI